MMLLSFSVTRHCQHHPPSHLLVFFFSSSHPLISIWLRKLAIITALRNSSSATRDMSSSLPLLIPLLLALCSLSSATPAPSPRLADYPQHPRAKQALTLVDISYSTVTSPATKVLPVLVVNAQSSVFPDGTATPLPDRTFLRWEPVTDMHPSLHSTRLHFGDLGANSRQDQLSKDKTYMWFAPKWLLYYYSTEATPTPTAVNMIGNSAGNNGLPFGSVYNAEVSPTVGAELSHGFLGSVMETAAPGMTYPMEVFKHVSD